MRCYVYRSKRKAETYLYLPEAEGFSVVPDVLMRVFGPPELAMDLVLSPHRRLASEDVLVVLRNLLDRGFHLQMPPADVFSTTSH